MIWFSQCCAEGLQGADNSRQRVPEHPGFNKWTQDKQVCARLRSVYTTPCSILSHHSHEKWWHYFNTSLISHKILGGIDDHELRCMDQFSEYVFLWRCLIHWHLPWPLPLDLCPLDLLSWSLNVRSKHELAGWWLCVCEVLKWSSISVGF